MKRNLFFCLVLLLLFSSCLRGNNKKVIFETSKEVTPQSLNSAKTLDGIFDPKISKDGFLNKIYYWDDRSKEDFSFSLYGNQQKTLLVNQIPFARYWQLEDEKAYVFHPMVLGRYVFSLHQNDKVETSAFLKEFERVATLLPNGGWAVYYPERYPLSRMLGPDWHYSAISQSEILSGFIKAGERRPEFKKIAELILKGMLFSYENGGTNLSGVSLLEIPLFSANPEIILNGWIHALLHLADYDSLNPSKDINSLIIKNLEFMSENLHLWYDENLNISKYSDTSPQKIEIKPTSNNKIDKIDVYYIAKNKKLSSYKHAITYDPKTKFGAFDTHIRNISKDNTLTMYVNCSQFFDTVISAEKPFELNLFKNIYEVNRATPTYNKKTPIVIKSFRSGTNLNYVRFGSKTQGLICGYPTNFKKANGKNYYHSQHIVGLLYLAHNVRSIPDNIKYTLIENAKKWYVNTLKYKQKKTADFASLQELLDGINRGKALNQETKASLLLKKSGIKELWNE
jgi:hypothetical protein